MQTKTGILMVGLLVLAWNYLMPTISVTKDSVSIPSFPIQNEEKPVSLISTIARDTQLNTLIIPSISLSQAFPDYQSVENGIAILKNSTHLTILAAHSGSGPNAIFTPIERLTVGDEIQWNQTSYIVSDLYYTLKDGDIELSLTDHFQYLILTTCSQKQKGKQFVVIAKK